MTGALPAGLAPEAAEAARGTIGGAVSVAGQLPAALGAALMDSARSAFAQAFEVTALIGGAISVGVAILAVVFLRRVRAAGTPVQVIQGMRNEIQLK
jgi:DHA2 family multidrug resistance protein-like MFS transporter